MAVYSPAYVATQAANARPPSTPGRPVNDRMASFHIQAPGRFAIEHGSHRRVTGPANGMPATRTAASRTPQTDVKGRATL